MAIVDISPFSYGILSLTNPHNWPNGAECDEYTHLVTGKSVYVWPLIFAAYVWHLESRKGIIFSSDLAKIDQYLKRHLTEFKQANPIDFSNAGSQYVKSKPGSFQAIRKSFGAPVKRLSIPDAERAVTEELRKLEKAGLIVDPFSVTMAGITIAVLGSVPVSFTKRTSAGDEKYLHIKALLWEFESLTKDEQREIRFHFFMEKAINLLKQHVQLLVRDVETPEN